MKGQIVYISGHKESEKQAHEALTSFQKYKWNVELVKGITPSTLKDSNPKIIEKSRLHDFREQNLNRYLTKVSCATNNLQFFKRVVEADQPMAFIEHDAICIDYLDDYDFEDCLILNAEHVFRPPNKLAIQQFKDFVWPSFGIADLPENFGLRYHKENAWKGAAMIPGTGAYALTPAGAKKMLSAVEKHGLDQSDFMINTANLRIQYINPSPVKFNKQNLSTSYGI